MRRRWAVLAGIILLAAFARFYRLADHFTHIDDVQVAILLNAGEAEILGFRASKQKLFDKNDPQYSSVGYRLKRLLARSGVYEAWYQTSRWLGVPASTTYAPAQFILTALLVNAEQDYYSSLFWGRFPSAFLGSLAVVALIFLYRKMGDSRVWSYQVVGATLIAFSWEHIIFSRQMENYAFGVTAAILLFWFFLWSLDRKPTVRNFLWIGLGTGLLCTTHYQISFLLPAFFGALFLWFLKERPIGLSLLAIMVPVGFMLAMYPLYRQFIHLRTQEWVAGPTLEYLYTIPSDAGLFGALIYTIKFLLRGLWVMVHSNLGFLPEKNPLSPLMVLTFIAMLIVGSVSFARASERKKRFLGLFLGLIFATWVGGALGRNVLLCPTRHSLILLPAMVLLITEGVIVSLTKLNRPLERASAVVALVVALSFFSGYDTFLEVFGAKFDPVKVQRLLDQHGAGKLLGFSLSQSPLLSPTLRSRYTTWAQAEDVPRKAPFGLISQRHALPPVWLESCEVLYKEESPSAKQSEYLDLTGNQRNQLFFYILRACRERLSPPQVSWPVDYKG